MTAEYLPADDPSYTITLDGRLTDVYVPPAELPSDDVKLATCMSHIGIESKAADLLGEFLLSGCHVPQEGEKHILRYQLACFGLTRFSRKCGLTLIQYDSEGHILTRRTSS